MRYLKLYEALGGYPLNYNLISDIKNMALEYIDEYYLLNIQVFIKNKPYSKYDQEFIQVYACKYDHNTLLTWTNPKIELYKDKKKNYNIMLIDTIYGMNQQTGLRHPVKWDNRRFNRISLYDANKDLISRVSESYSKEIITNHRFNEIGTERWMNF